MRKLLTIVVAAILAAAALTMEISAATHTVVKGESLWKIAVRYQVGFRELKEANPQIKNFDLIYPGQIIHIPEFDQTVLEYEQEVVRLVNEIRVENGLKPLTYDWELSRVARYKSQDMRDNRYFAHNSPVYGTPFEMMRNFGITFHSAGENIAMGYQTPQAVVNGWMNSPGHRANILNAGYTRIGVGYVADGNYWTQMFISR